ncbi:MAG: hypothetical protein H6622_14675 [Halobacteriovoraceae bacterium]|nr:hypothetical protein [Halobacteriovoraceae bacterium]
MNKLFLIISLGISTIIFSSERPEWIESPYSVCDIKTEVCGVGESYGRMSAEVAAKKSLASYFETKISGITKSSKEMTQLSDGEGIISGESKQFVDNEISEAVDQSLEGVVIDKVYEDKESIFVLARLDKQKMARELRTEINKLDEQIIALNDEGSRSSFYKLIKISAIRDGLAKRYQFVSDMKLAPKISFSEIKQKQTQYLKKGVTLYIDFDEKEKYEDLFHGLSGLLLEMNYRIVENKAQKVDQRIKVTLKVKPQEMNVRGFEKNKFILEVNSHTDDGVKKGGTQFETISIGRSLKQSYQDAFVKIMDHLKSNITDLNID